MEVATVSKYNRISPKKMRLVSSQLHGRGVNQALETLRFANKKAATMIAKAMKTALADATHNYKLNEADLIVKTIEINGGPTLKRFIARSRGMGHPILKRSSHIRVVLTEKVKEETKKEVKKEAKVTPKADKEAKKE